MDLFFLRNWNFSVSKIFWSKTKNYEIWVHRTLSSRGSFSVGTYGGLHSSKSTEWRSRTNNGPNRLQWTSCGDCAIRFSPKVRRVQSNACRFRSVQMDTGTGLEGARTVRIFIDKALGYIGNSNWRDQGSISKSFKNQNKIGDQWSLFLLGRGCLGIGGLCRWENSVHKGRYNTGSGANLQTNRWVKLRNALKIIFQEIIFQNIFSFPFKPFLSKS